MKHNNLPEIYTQSSVQLLKARFLKKRGRGIESPKTLFKRVANWIAKADKNYNKKNYRKTMEDFFDILYNLKFIPNSPTLMNAGKKNKTLAACFVLPIQDSLDSIYKTLSDAVTVQWNGGGTGFNFSNIRPRGDVAGGIDGVAAGPLHVIKTYSKALMGIRQGGKRGGGNMAILNVDHPDILDFISLKMSDRTIMNFNISVGITEAFMDALKNDDKYELINPRNNKTVKKLRAREVFQRIAEMSHKTGDPGVAFIDKIEAANKTPHVGRMDATNPCGEQPLLPYESCNLGALNLRAHFDKEKKDVNWNELKNTIYHGVHFLDNVIDTTDHVLEKIEQISKYTNRKIGLGLMGFADVLLMKEIPYNSRKGIKFAEKIMRFIQENAVQASIELAKERGTFGAYEGSVWEKEDIPVRNATITTLAPNGNTSIIGGSTGGIEPIYALVYKIGGVENSNYRATETFLRVNQAFKYLAEKYDFYSDELLEKIANETPIEKIDEIPSKLRKVLVTALDIEPKWHIKMQAAFQKHVDNAISKTINFPKQSTIDDIRRAFIDGYKRDLKGMTIYRDGSKEAQTYVSTKDAKLNIEGKKKESREKGSIEILIGSRNNQKIEDIESFLKEHNGTYKIIKSNYKTEFNDTKKRKDSIDAMVNTAKKRATRVANEKGTLTISDKTALVFKGEGEIKKNLSNVEYFGKQGDHSEKLFEKLTSHFKDEGRKAYICSAIAVVDPSNKNTLSTVMKIPGKLVRRETKSEKYYFIHEGLKSFQSAPSKEQFKSFHHRYTALAKVFEKMKRVQNDMIEMNLTPNAYQVLEKRALKKDKNGNIVETPSQLYRRIANYVAKAGKNYNDSRKSVQETSDDFFEILTNLEFQCGGALIWAGMSGKQGKKAVWSKCFVLPVEDSINSIFDTLNDNIEVLRHGGGTGFNFSNIRSTYASVQTTGEKAAGPVEYIKVYNRAQDTIIGRGGRHMGSMAILNVDHPNIEEFISAKDEDGQLAHYNISVGVTEKFMKAVRNDEEWKLIDPHDNKVYKKIKAKYLMKKIAEYAWKSGDPGIIYLDELEKFNTTPHLGKIDATNVCGEQPLLPYESCNLGNIDISRFVKGFPYLEDDGFRKKRFKKKMDYIDWEKLEQVTKLGVEFMDNLIDINTYPIRKIEEMTKKTRNVGIGIMGFADVLIKLGVKYGSHESVKIAEKIMEFINQKGHEKSQELGKKRGNFPAFEGSRWDKQGIKNMRNTRVTTIAPTGTISIVADCNPGIEPIFALVYKRMKSLGGTEQLVVEKLFEKVAKKRKFYSRKLMEKLSSGVHLDEFDEIPDDVKEIFKTSHEIKPEKHVEIQAAFQKHIDSAVSKTINLPNKATVEDIIKIYQKAYEERCKGITVFRDGSKCGVQSRSKQKNEQDENRQSKKKVNPKPRSRPQETRGVTKSIKTDQGSLFITINEDKKGIAEVFLNIGKSGGYSSGYTEAIGRLISVSLRAGLALDTIIDQLKGIRTSAPTLNKGMFIYSVPDAVAKILEQYKKERAGSIPMFKEKAQKSKDAQATKSKTEQETESDVKKVPAETPSSQEKAKDDQGEHSHYSSENKYDDMLNCPDCNGDLEYAEGCILCRSCGYSKCG